MPRAKKAKKTTPTQTTIQEVTPDEGQSPTIQTSPTTPEVTEVPEAYVEIHKEVQPQLAYIKEGFIIQSQEWAQWTEQAEIFLDKRIKDAEKTFKKLKKPFNEGLVGLTTQYNKVVDPWKAAQSRLATALLSWKRIVDAKQDQVQQEAATRRTEEVKTISETTGMPAATVEQNLPSTPQVPTPAPLQDLGTRKLPRWRVTDMTQIPYAYRGVPLYCLDDKAITQLRKDAGEDLGLAPPGIEYYYEETLVHPRSGEK